MKRQLLIVDSSVEWVDRNQIADGDVIIAISTDGVKHVCSSLGTENSFNRWQVINPLTGHIHAYAPFFIHLFKDENKELLKGWKFYKLED